MTAMMLRWRQLPPPIVTRWRGPDLKTSALAATASPAPLALAIGPPGLTGAPGSQGATQAVASTNLIKGQAVAIDRATFKFIPGDPSYKPKAFVIGLTDAAITSGFVGNALTGPVTMSDWTAIAGTAALSPGVPYFLAPAGTITATPPTSPNCLTVIGVAASTTTLNVDPQPPIQI